MTPFRYSFRVYAAPHGHSAGVSGSGHFETIVQPQERFVYGNGPVRVLVENGKRLKRLKVVQ